MTDISITHLEHKLADIFISAKPDHLSGSTAVRELLDHGLQQLDLTDTLDDSQLPYCLTPSNRHVSFSHSSKRVAIAIAKQNGHRLGIDVEDNMVSMQVAQRFFSPTEAVWLDTLTSDQQASACQMLWMAKEAIIKANSGKLLSGLTFNLLNHLDEPSDILEDNSSLTLELSATSLLILNTTHRFALCVHT